MPGAITVFIVWTAAVLVLGAALIVLAPTARDHPPARDAFARVDDVIRMSSARLGSVGTALVAYLAGFGALVLVCWPLGLLAHAVQNPIDWPVFRWFEARQVGGWSEVWRQLTNIGKPRITQGFDALAAVFFAIVWKIRRQRWWVPLVTLPAAYFLIKYTQILLQDVVHRGHPPTTLGTYPSGGCARVILIYGLIIFMGVTWLRPTSRRTWAVGLTFTALLWTIQAYARTYNLEHWLSDVVGGSVLGALALVIMISVFRVLSRTPALPGPLPKPASTAGGQSTTAKPVAP